MTAITDDFGDGNCYGDGDGFGYGNGFQAVDRKVNIKPVDQAAADHRLRIARTEDELESAAIAMGRHETKKAREYRPNDEACTWYRRSLELKTAYRAALDAVVAARR